MTDVSESPFASRPPESFWREVPCGHPPDPVAWINEDGSTICHCGWSLDDGAQAMFTTDDGMNVYPCGKCGCAVAVPQ